MTPQNPMTQLVRWLYVADEFETGAYLDIPWWRGVVVRSHHRRTVSHAPLGINILIRIPIILWRWTKWG